MTATWDASLVVGSVRTPRQGERMRVLVDRLWPRGVSKEAADLDLWAKNATPSDDLRKRFHAGVLDFDAFAEAYRAELQGGGALDELTAAVRDGAGERTAGCVVLLVSAKHPSHPNHAEVLKEALVAQLRGPHRPDDTAPGGAAA